MEPTLYTCCDLDALHRFLTQFPNYAPAGGDLGCYRTDLGDSLPILVRRVQDTSRYRAAFKDLAQEVRKGGNPGAVFLLHDPHGNCRLGYVEMLYRGRRNPLPAGRSVLIRAGYPNKTARQRLALLAERAKEGVTLDALRDAFSVDAVTTDFYREFVRVFEETLVPGVVGLPEERRRDFLLGLVARVLFLAFVAKRGWLGGREDFLPWLLRVYQEQGLMGQNQFYREWLNPLFFRALKGPPGAKGSAFEHLPEHVRQAYLEAPYLNGELFAPFPGLDDPVVYVKDQALDGFFSFLFAYNFTVEENTAYEVDLELNPELLGLILERLVNTVGVEGRAMELGAHYTPRVEVDLMVRLGLAEWLHRQGLPLAKAYALFAGEADHLDEDERRRAKEALLTAKILDPAVGSGAFLVGALQVVEEALDALGEARTLDRKKKLLQNLYGVDALSWAVWMAELRLWLAYFLELPQSAKASMEPLLPSLGLHLVRGDTVLQRLDDRPVPTRLEVAPLAKGDAEVRKALDDLLDAEQGYFHNRGVNLEEVGRKREAFLLAVLDALYGKGQPALLVEGKLERYQREREILKERIGSKERPFLYLLDFAEVMVGEGGFDLVIGNPPYVRQEAIADPLRHLEPSAYKALIREEVRQELGRWPGLEGSLPDISGRSDLYAYFYARTLALLKETGVHVFIASDSWLDVQYGAWLREIFLRSAPLRYVIENRAKRSFRADVNVAITVAWAPQGVPSGWEVLFVSVEAPFEEIDLLQALGRVLCER